MTVKHLRGVFSIDDLEEMIFTTIDSKSAYNYTVVPENAEVIWIKPDYFTGRLTVYVKGENNLSLQ